jgi:hypothetical protein
VGKRFPFTPVTQTKEETMTNVEKLLMKRMKKTDSKVNYKTLHLDTLKEIEKNKHLRGDSYADSVIDDMSADDLY